MGAEELEHPTKTPANSQVSREGGANSGATGDGSQESDGRMNDDVAAALALIANLPLSKEEQAEAVRRLLGRGKQRGRMCIAALRPFRP
jgi:hypothetical protein